MSGNQRQALADDRVLDEEVLAHAAKRTTAPDDARGRGLRIDDHVVAGLQTGHVCSDVDDLTGRFVAQWHRGHLAAWTERATAHVQERRVGAADAAGTDRQVKLLADVDPGPAGLVKAALVFAGIAGAVGPPLVELDDEALNQYLTEAGRRTLGLRTSRRPARSS